MSRDGLGIALIPFLLLTVAGCGPGHRDDLYLAEKRLWKIGRTQSALASLPPDAQVTAQKQLAQSYRDLALSIPSPGALDASPTRDSVENQLLRIRAMAQIQEARWLVEAGETESAADVLRAASMEHVWSPTVAAETFRHRLRLLQRTGDPYRYHEAVEEMMRELDLAELGEELPVPVVQSFRMVARLFNLEGDEDRAAVQREIARHELKRLLDKGISGTFYILVHTELALLALDAGQLTEVAEHYEAALRAGQGTEWETSLEFALANLELGALDNPEGSIDRFGRLAQRHPRSPLAARGLLMAGRALLTLGDYDEAQRILSRADTLAARDLSLHASVVFERALLEERRGDWERALSLFRQVQADAPRTRVGMSVPLQLASHHFSRGDHEAAETILNRAIEEYDEIIASDSGSESVLKALEIRSRARVLLEDWDGAVESLLELARRAPDSDLAPLALAEAARLSQEELSQEERSREIWQMILDLYPHAPLAVLAARQLQQDSRP